MYNRDRGDLLAEVFASDHKHIVMTLAMMSLALRGHREHLGDGDCHTIMCDKPDRGLE